MDPTIIRMKEDLLLRRLSKHTIYNYVGVAKNFAEFCQMPLVDAGPEEIRGFILNRVVERKASASTHKRLIAALKFLYGQTLNSPEKVDWIPWPKVPFRRQRILTTEEISLLIQFAGDPRYRIVFMVAYATGLRVSELASLQTQDIDRQAQVIHIRNQKGG